MTLHSNILRIASELPKGDTTRRELLALLRNAGAPWPPRQGEMSAALWKALRELREDLEDWGEKQGLEVWQSIYYGIWDLAPDRQNSKHLLRVVPEAIERERWDRRLHTDEWSQVMAMVKDAFRNIRSASKSARGVYVTVRDLPDSVQRVLRQVKYGRKDIAVAPARTYQMSGASGDGYKAFTAAVNLETGQYKIEWGSWGGANMFNPRNPVDLDTTPRPIRPNMAVVSGTIGGGRPTWAHIDVHPDNVQKLLGSGDDVEVSLKEKAVLNIIGGIKSSYRKDEFWRKDLGKYSLDNPLIESLLAKGMIKANRAGALSITLKGKNAR